MTDPDVLVVGAGPTGLTLACDLARRGVPTRLIDRAPRFPTGSRGKGLTPRTLEVLDDLGVVDAALAAGATHLPHRKYAGAEVVHEIDPEAGRDAAPDVPYPVGLLIPQWRLEQLLRQRLADLGGTVESGTELRELTQDPDGVTATVTGPSGQGRIRARYLVGCDGGRSTVRRLLGLALHGHTPQAQVMAVGDVRVDGLNRDAWHQWFTPDGGIMLCPLPGTDHFQVQSSPELAGDGTPLEPTLERFQATFDRVAGVPGVRLRELAWRSTYRVNVRMVDRLRVDRVFLAGDAAHVHPVAGGLGMNSGIQDAYNLGWKLGLTLTGQAASSLLDTYDEERLPVAGWLLDITTARLEAALDAIRRVGGGVDAVAAPELSQLGLGYRWSRLSREAAGRADDALRAGDRAPDSPVEPAHDRGRRLFGLYRGPHLTLLGTGPRCAGALDRATRDPAAGRLVRAGLLRTHLVAGPLAGGYGRDALVVVRPDGYVGLVAAADDAATVTGYLRDLADPPGRS